ncbi:hypothetical protein DFH06DRAFT_425511 [Mycena polygramma]|nr:hypothetical protein DFH06DRAFT_425511 [Mycena polygramma]
MSRETPNASFIRKSLAAVPKIGHANHDSLANPSIRKPSLESHRIFNLSLCRLASSPRLVSKPRYGAHKPPNLHSPEDPDASTSLDEDDSMYNEQDSPATGNSAPDLPSTTRALLPPPGLNLPQPPRYPIIVPKKNVVLPPGITPPPHWAPGGSCDVRIEPEPTIRFQPRPGYNPPLYWHPGGRATRLDKPECDAEASSATVQNLWADILSDGELRSDQVDTTFGNDAERDGGKQDVAPGNKDPIQAQLEHLLDLTDALLDSVNLPGVPQSVWATCPTPPPLPRLSLPAQRLTRKASSYALLDYLLFECGYDLDSLSRLEARFPVLRPDPKDVPEEAKESTPDVTELDSGNGTDDLVLAGTPEEVDGGLKKRNEFVVPLQTMVSVLDDILRTLDNEHPDATSALEHPLDPTVQKPDSNTTVYAAERSIECTNLGPPVPISMASEAPSARSPPLYIPPLSRSRSLPEGWRMSAFTVFGHHSPPPSPTPSKPKPKAKGTKMYMHAGPVISSVESLAAPLQSGRGYLRTSMTAMKNKVKTRPDAGAVKPESPVVQGVPLTRTFTGKSLNKPSLFSRLGGGNKRGERTQEPEPQARPKAAGKWVGKMAKLTKATGEKMRVLMRAGTANARELSWKDFCKMMKELGFRIEVLDGTAVKFHPPGDLKDLAITLHKPAEKVCHAKTLDKLREALVDTYGWTSEEIEAALGRE